MEIAWRTKLTKLSHKSLSLILLLYDSTVSNQKFSSIYVILTAFTAHRHASSSPITSTSFFYRLCEDDRYLGLDQQPHACG
ncbi:hypothetical protein EDD18DRAFT_1170548 [Armillaria luteobubalina]|uniref:Uncharacterized protein n=1 Tax=Armillaria luteobubalina TaxID=153913 RepID=A0AA39Q4N3_9AGAR|nr:hypothetical protein EDD18DRAFT_1170548 [Armillaria luteobubalina]